MPQCHRSRQRRACWHARWKPLRHSTGADSGMCPPATGCRVPQVVKEHRTARLLGGHIMNADDLKKLTTESLKELATLLEQGRSERLIALLKTMGRFHRYSLHNVCLIVAQRPSATRVAGFHTWRSVGRFVRRGEKGIAILAPIVRRRLEETQKDEPRVIAGFRTAYVFDVEQTDGAPLPQTADVAGDPGEHT